MPTKLIKSALRQMAYGVYVLGVEHHGETRAATITWVTQASFSPVLVVMGIRKDGRPFGILKNSGKFALSILETGQKDIAYKFFKTAAVEGGLVGGLPCERTAGGLPVLSDAMAWLDGTVQSIDETGDHAVVLGQVTGAAVKREGVPLTLQEMGLKYGG